MSDSLPQPSPDDATKSDEIPAQNVPTPTEPAPAQPAPSDAQNDEEIDEQNEAEIEIPIDPVAQAADREGFRFIAIGFVFFFIIIIVCGSIVALVMKSMGI